MKHPGTQAAKDGATWSTRFDIRKLIRRLSKSASNSYSTASIGRLFSIANGRSPYYFAIIGSLASTYPVFGRR